MSLSWFRKGGSDLVTIEVFLYSCDTYVFFFYLETPVLTHIFLFIVLSVFFLLCDFPDWLSLASLCLCCVMLLVSEKVRRW